MKRALGEHAESLNREGQWGRTARQLNSAVDSCASWTWRTLVLGEGGPQQDSGSGVEASVERTVRLTVSQNERLGMLAVERGLEEADLLREWVVLMVEPDDVVSRAEVIRAITALTVSNG